MPNPIDLTGKRVGRLLVVKRAANNKDGRTMWLCRCDCGNERVVSGKSLRNGHTKSCGCLNRDIASKMSLKDHTGERFGHLVVLRRADDYISPGGRRHVRWACRCDCGNEIEVDTCELVGSGENRSCGCYKSEVTRVSHTTHNGSHDRLYKVYSNIKNRCYNRNSNDYKYYGERGIKMCEEWYNDYASFRDWAYKNGYNEEAAFGECTIDRIDVDGMYEPTNCRWVNMSVQSANRRNVINKRNDKCPREDN